MALAQTLILLGALCLSQIQDISATTGGPSTPCPIFTARPGMRAFSGAFAGSGLSIAQCQAECELLTDCWAFELFNTQGPGPYQCWTHSGTITAISASAPNTLYVRDCAATTQAVTPSLSTVDVSTVSTPVSCWSFTDFPDMNRNGGIRVPGSFDLATCKSVCLGFTLDECSAVNHAGNGCWRITASAMIDNVRGPQPGVLEAARIDICSTTAASVSASASTATATATTPPDCLNVFTQASNMHRTSGLRQADADQAGCEAICVLRGFNGCPGYDHNPMDRGCWLHTPSSILGAMLPMENVNHFMRVDQCATVDPSSVSPGCVDTYNETTSTAYFAGIQEAVSTQADCQARCNSKAFEECVGFDFNNNDNTCWLHNQATKISRNQYSITLISHFARISCTLTTPGVDVCVDAYNEVRGQFSFDGIFSSLDNSRGLCQAKCTATDTCVGFDLTSFNQCFWHIEATFQAKNEGDPNTVSQFIRIPCGTTPSFTAVTPVCQDEFTKFTNTLVLGATGDPSVNTYDACANVCRANMECIAYDFNNQENKCWIHSSGNDITNRITGANVDHYVRTFKCNGTATGTVCVDSFTESQNSNGVGGEVQNSITTVALCNAECRKSVRTDTKVCYGFDFNVAKSECWLLFTSDFTFNNGSMIGINHFRRSFCTDQTTLAGGCVDRFNLTQNANAAGGLRQDGINSDAACKVKCQEAPEGSANYCHGYDFNTQDNTCWLHPAAGFNINTGRPGVNNYRREQSCPSTTPGPGQGCRDAYNLTNNNNALGGEEQTGAASLVACQDQCQASNRTCYGFDFDPSNPKCWFHYSDSYVLSTSNGIDNYRRQFTCITTSCDNQYNVTNDYHGFQGQEVATATTEPACRAACNAKPPDTTSAGAEPCFAYDFNTNTNVNTQRCFLFNTRDYSRGTGNGINHYIRSSNCGQQRTTSVPGCIVSFTKRDNTNALGGAEMLLYTSNDACAQACRDVKECTAYDFNRVDNSCYHFLVIVVPGRIRNNVNTDHYVRNNNCDDGSTTIPPQACRMVKQPDGNAVGGISQAGTFTEESCAARCQQNDACRALDFNYQDQTCFFHTLDNLNVDPNTCCAHWVKQCDDTCQDTYTKSDNSNARNGNVVDGVNTVSGCERACTRSDQCTGFDYNAFDRCYLHVGDFVITGGVTGVDNYRRVKCTGPGTGNPTGSPTVRTTKCPDTFTKNENYSVRGGRGNSGRDVRSCQAMCVSDPACTGIDYDNNVGGIRCFLHYGVNPSLISANGVDHYDLRRCDQPSTTPDSTTTTRPTTTTQRTTTTTRAPPSGLCDTDVSFLLDTSGSIPANDFPNVINIIRQVVNELNFQCRGGTNRDCVRVSVVIFSGSAFNIFTYDTYRSKQDLMNALSSIPYLRGDSNPASALGLALDALQGSDLMGRSNVIIMITDLNVTNNAIFQTAFRNQANNLRNERNNRPNRLSMLLVAVGSVNNANLNILSPDSTVRVQNIADQNAGNQAAQTLLRNPAFSTCRGGGVGPV